MLDAHHRRLGIDFHDDGVHAAGRAPVVRAEVGGRLQPRRQALVRDLRLGCEVGEVADPVVQVMAPPGVALTGRIQLFCTTGGGGTTA